METKALTLYSWGYGELRTYAAAALFAAGNIILPQMFHLVHQGGMVWLPIYFFTLVGAYKYGWRVGLLTAVASPLVNSALFGMPGVAMLPVVLVKSVLLAVFAGLAAARLGRASLALLALVVAGYQAVGTLGEWAILGSLTAALHDLRLGIPGMLLQVVGGWAVINLLLRR